MKIILIMNVTGSVLLALYFLVKHLFRERLTRKYLYAILRVTIVCFLVPLILVGEVYKSIMADVLLLAGRHFNRTIQVNQGASMFMQADKGVAVSMGMKDKAYLLTGYIVIVVLLFACGIIWERMKRRPVRRAIKKSGITAENPVLLELKEKCKVRRKVQICSCEKEEKVGTVGMIHPVIFFKDPGDDFEKRALLCHELCHIRRYDVLWRWMSFLVFCIHFWNIATHILLAETRRIQEHSCDEWVIRDMSLEERGKYASLLIRNSTEDADTPVDKVLKLFKRKRQSVVFFGENDTVKRVKERVNLIMKYDMKNKIGKKLAVLVMAGVLFASSLTALAYDDIRWWGGSGEETISRMAGELDETLLMNDAFVIFKSNEKDYKKDYPIMYEKEYIDSEENVHPLNDSKKAGAPSKIICFFHSYQEATVLEHYVLSDGSCAVYYYDAVLCEKCGYTKNRTLIGIDRFESCPHNF